VSFMMGVWFLSISFAQYIAGIIAQFTTKEVTADGGILQQITKYVSGLSPEIVAEKGGGAFSTLLSYSNVFSTIGVVAIAMALLALIVTPLIRKLMHGEH
ncbi:MAG: hypothetical protein R6U64_02565, partial [Bacteroidales bacterium]